MKQGNKMGISGIVGFVIIIVAVTAYPHVKGAMFDQCMKSRGVTERPVPSKFRAEFDECQAEIDRIVRWVDPQAKERYESANTHQRPSK